MYVTPAYPLHATYPTIIKCHLVRHLTTSDQDLLNLCHICSQHDILALVCLLTISVGTDLLRVRHQTTEQNGCRVCDVARRFLNSCFKRMHVSCHRRVGSPASLTSWRQSGSSADLRCAERRPGAQTSRLCWHLTVNQSDRAVNYIHGGSGHE